MILEGFATYGGMYPPKPCVKNTVGQPLIHTQWKPIDLYGMYYEN